MFQLRYYRTLKSKVKLDNNFEVVGVYGNIALARGMRVKKSKEPHYKLDLLIVVSNE